MRVLVLGGSWFVGRTVIEEASGRGHDVTVFNRGVTPSPLPAGVRRIVGDRESAADVRSLARSGPWDVVIDVSGSVPAVVRRSASALADVAERCVFVSTISAYREWPHAPVDENSPVWDADPDNDPGTRRWDPDAYGPLKVGCEIACQEAFGLRRLLVLRPHVVLGRYEYVGRLPWWLARMRQGGQVLAPAPDRAIQPIDVRDLAQFLLDCVERGDSGLFNVAPLAEAASYSLMLHACMEATVVSAQRQVELVWVDEDWLLGQGVTQWTELPLWRNAAAPWGMNVDRAYAAGLRCRPLADTVYDTWAWLRDGGRAVDHQRFAEHGIAAEKESAIIGRWLTRTGRAGGLSRPASSQTPG
ncbi:NAD-dependent epimerase/dehydratase family protein [Dactylosporangium sp. NPDC000555]|uniref:NAD-dependent epimerase/dehydratase family protein n=1 Tax=Dactylosporangium sp. NPDC000555 TaxID=3154260 RepID=UPI0033281DE6